MFQQDNEAKQRCKKGFVLEWPSQNPALNPIENLWRDKKIAVRQKFALRNGRKWLNQERQLKSGIAEKITIKRSYISLNALFDFIYVQTTSKEVGKKNLILKMLKSDVAIKQKEE